MISSSVKISQIVFDFDNTLFDTESLKDVFWRIAALHGYGKRNAQTFYQEARTQGERIMIAMESYLDVLKKHVGQDNREFKAAEVIEAIMDAEKAKRLLPGAVELLTFCKEKEIPRYLLSLGVADWQEDKIKRSGVDAFFDPATIVFTDYINEGKIEALRKLFGENFTGAETVLVNDKPDETAELLKTFPALVALVRREKRDERFEVSDFEKLEQQFPERVAWSEKLSDLQTILQTLL